MPFASIAPSTWLANAEISTVSTPSQKHPASFQVFSNALHAIDVGLAHFVTSGITEHVETLGVLFVVVVVSPARATKAPQQITTKKEKKDIFLFEGSIVFARAREDEREREREREDGIELCLLLSSRDSFVRERAQPHHRSSQFNDSRQRDQN